MPAVAVQSRRVERAFRAALRPPERLSICEWAQRHLRLSPKVTPYPGPLRLDLTPYARGVLDAFRDPRIETIYLCFGGQTAKTTTMIASLLYSMDQDPGSALWVMPSKDLARSFSQNRLQPLIDETPILAAQKPADDDRYKTLEMQMRRMTLALIGANSPSELSSRPIRYLFADEVDKYPVETTREGSALNLARRRTASYWNRRIVVSSTPSLIDGQIWLGLLSGDWREFWVPCPHCREMQVLRFPGIRKPAKLQDLDKIREIAWYECVACEKRITNVQKAAMIAGGEWRPKAEAVSEYEWTPPPPGGRTASFHLPSWYSPWVKWGEVLARFLEAQPYPEVLREIINGDFAEPWEERGEAKREEDILAHRGAYGDGHLPSDAQAIALVQTVDVQQDSLYYTVRAWGPFEESWLVAHGILPDFPALAETLAREYDGQPVRLCLIDSGFRTDQVYEFCRVHRGCLPVKGSEQIRTPAHWSTLDKMPDGKPIPGGLRLLAIQSSYFRGMLFRRLDIKEGDPGRWHLHADVDEDYARQLIAEILVEKRDKRGRIHREWKQVRRANHYLDCEVYQLAAAYVLGIRYATKAQAPPGGQGPQPPPAGPPEQRRPTGWTPTRFKI